MTTHPACGKTWTGLRMEHCPVCCETFPGSTLGDAHRVGSYADNSRRCLTAEEMTEKGWRLIRDVWHGPEMPESALSKIRRRTNVAGGSASTGAA